VEKNEFKILVVDDDDIARGAIDALLSREGYSVASARNGIEAMNFLRREDVELVLTDLRMPGADGFEVLRFAARNNPDAAVVILTGFGTIDNTMEAIKDGAYDYLTKPFKVQELILLAENVYKRALLIRDNRELKKHLRDTYRDMELIKSVAGSNHADITTGWIERIERLRSLSVLSIHEAEQLKERLVRGNAGA
jgi:DNA-binding NtrC family response regulator